MSHIYEGSLKIVMDPAMHIVIIAIISSRESEKAMASPLQYPCLENHMDGEAW